MTQQPFSRPGAIDLSGLQRPAPASAPGGAPGAAPTRGAAGGSSYSLDVTQANLQQLLQESMTAPVVLVFHSASQAPGSEAYAADVAAVVEGLEGKLLAGLVDIDAAPEIAQAMQIPQVPLLLVVLDGRPVTQPIPGALSREELSTLFGQLFQQLTAQGISGRHQPRSAAPSAGEDEEPQVDPRYAAAQDALGEGDIDRAVAEYQKLVDANPADTEAAAGLAMAKVLQRTQGADLQTARAAAADAPDDVDAQTLVADLDLLGGHVEDAFNRLVALVARTSDADRTKARDHLLGLFAAVGNDDERVLAGRRNLASALF
jgi:thioredoxin-like negative regulator of GroEL